MVMVCMKIGHVPNCEGKCTRAEMNSEVESTSSLYNTRRLQYIYVHRREK